MQKFSFSTDLIKFNVGENIHVSSKESFTEPVTVLIRSNYLDLDNKIYRLEPGETELFRYTPRLSGFVKATRVWGAIWDINGYLDLKVELRKPDPVTTITSLNVDNPIGVSAPIQRTILYDFQGWTNIEIFKTLEVANQSFEFWLSEHDGAYYQIVSSDSDFVIRNPHMHFSKNNNKYIEITEDDIKYLKLCLKIFFGGMEFDFQGVMTLKDLEQELYTIFANDEKIQVYRQINSIIIYSDYTDISKVKLMGMDNSVVKTFKTIQNDHTSAVVQCVSSDWLEKTVQFTIIADGQIRRPVLTVHFKNVKNSKYDITVDLEQIIVGKEFILTLSCEDPITEVYNLQYPFALVDCNQSVATVVDDYTQFWKVKAVQSGVATFSVPDIFEESFTIYDQPKNIQLLNSLQLSKEEVILKIYMNESLEVDYDYTFELQDKLSKQNVDYRLVSTYHTINAGQLERKERLVWTTSQILRSFDIILNGQTIPVLWIDRAAYPSTIAIKSGNTCYINRAVNKPLTLKYLDGTLSGTIVLAPNQTSWDYAAISKVVSWQIYDQNVLILEKNVEYQSDKKPYLRMNVDASINSKSVNYVFLTLDWPVNYTVDVEVSSSSNCNINLNGSYQFKVGQTEMKFKITPTKITLKPSFLSLQLVSSNVDFSNERVNVIIS